MDLGTIIGLVVGLGMILGGNLIEGGKIAQIAQPTAAMIVIGGTVGATMVQFPLKTFIRAMKNIRMVFQEPPNHGAQAHRGNRGVRDTARKDGILALEKVADGVAIRSWRGR